MAAESTKVVVQVSQQDLLCKMGCGFYGNPQWQGYCSKCYRVHQAALKKQEDFAKNRTLLSFDQFQEKRKQHSDKRTTTIRSILRKSPSRNEVGSAGTSTKPSPSLVSSNTASLQPSRSAPIVQKTQHQPPAVLQRKLSSESQSGREKFLSFLHELPKPVAHEISRQTQHAVDKIQQHVNLSSDEISEMVQDLYQIIGDRLKKSQLMKDAKYTPEEVLEHMESYVCIRAYHALFCRDTDEEVGDISLQDRIRSLHWVTCGFLENHLDFSIALVRDKIDSAVTEIVDMNGRRTPRDKLRSLVQCSKFIFEALKESRGAPASADEYLPALIYVILKANPPLLQSNVNFVSRFSLPIKLMSGEAGYYFTNLCCAKNYIQNMNADSLKMPREEFEAYTSGQLVPPLTEANCGCIQAIKSMENTLKELEKLTERNDALEARVAAFRERAERETEELLQEVKAFSEMYPEPKPLEDWLDGDLSPEKNGTLPPPMQPLPVTRDS